MMDDPNKLHHTTADEKTIFIASSCTVFCSESPISGSVEELLSLYKKVIAQAKENGAKIVFKYKTKSEIKSLSETLPQAISEYNAHYNALLVYWREKLKQMPSPAEDRSFYEGQEHDVRVAHSHAMHYARAQSTPIGQMNRIRNMLKSFLCSDLSATTTIYL